MLIVCITGIPLSTALGIKKKKSKFRNADGNFDEEDTNYDEFSISSSLDGSIGNVRLSFIDLHMLSPIVKKYTIIFR